MILSCNNISKSFNDKKILSDVSFNLNDQEKAAIVGINGAGKSTLFKIITNELPSDKGDVIIPKDASVSYLSQHPDITSNRTIYEEMLDAKKDIIEMENSLRDIEIQMKHATDDKLQSLMNRYSALSHDFELKNGFAYKSEINGILYGLGFNDNDFSKNIQTLSGGEKTRVFLGKMLISSPELILLDEPTNHLDMNSIIWLENYLSSYKGALLIISHDRFFIDKVATKIIEIENSNFRVFTGNYTDYAKKKDALYKDQLKAYLNQQKEIKHQQEVIDKLKSFNREKSIKRAESREKMLDKIEVMDKPALINDKMKLSFETDITSGNDVLKVSNLSKSFNEKHLFSDINFEIHRGEKVAILGDNGTGKSTILKIINELIKPDSGNIEIGTNVYIGYYDQELKNLNEENTIFEEISNTSFEISGTKVRNILAAFLFTEDDVFKKISSLSGGEKARVSLIKLMLSKANFLILDEPTNHLDMASKEILEEALNDYEGTLLYVSHDRYFINKTASRILELTHKNVINYIGNFDYYLEKRDILTEKIINTDNISSDTEKNPSESLKSWEEMKEEKAKKKKQEKELKNTEERIGELEKKSSELTEKMSDPEYSHSASKLLEITKELDSINEELSELYEKWESLI